MSFKGNDDDRWDKIENGSEPTAEVPKCECKIDGWVGAHRHNDGRRCDVRYSSHTHFHRASSWIIQLYRSYSMSDWMHARICDHKIKWIRKQEPQKKEKRRKKKWNEMKNRRFRYMFRIIHNPHQTTTKNVNKCAQRDESTNVVRSLCVYYVNKKKITKRNEFTARIEF